MSEGRVFAEKVYKIIDKVLEDMNELSFEYREGQVNVMYTVIDSFEEKRNKIIEAGVGIGKSFGYLIPGILFSHFTGKPLIVSTSSIQLTEQLSDDVKTVESLLSPYLNGRRVEYVIGKGRNNYPCVSTIQNKLAKTGNKAKVYEDILKKVGPGVDRQNPNGIDAKYWNEITQHECMKTKGFDKNDCYLYKMRADLLKKPERKDIRPLYDPRVLIVNQDLLINHYKNIANGRKAILPESACLLIIDEVHNLEEKTREALTSKIKQRNITSVLNEVKWLIKNHKLRGELSKIENEFLIIFDNIKKQVTFEIQNDSNLSVGDRITIVSGDKEKCKKIRKIIKDLLTSLILKVESSNIRGYRRISTEEVINGLEEMAIFLEAYGSLAETNIIWAEMNDANHDTFSIYYCPGNIGKTLNKHVFSKSIPSVGMSATITLKDNGVDSYEYIKSNIGFDDENGDWETPEESPFDYDKSRLFLPDNVPDYYERGNSSYYNNITRIINDIVANVKGGSLVLFTAKSDMDQIHERLVTSLKMPLYIDDGSMMPKQIITQFKKTRGIILSAGSFWEGIDLKKELLTNLIIVKLPFPVPDPVIQNKINRYGRNQVLLPEMITRLRQGTGRLIRTNTDVGVVSILDSRACNSSYNYSDTVLEAIPFKYRITKLKELKEFQMENSL
ncbi:ATP-dependent DNA helicase [Marinilactibacillus psychrotolerans]|uniref:ATP-dependent DNA helicase n=2 Tax=Marinilactibacillus psychrotolerans TaxID=191770 RepID=A0A5R9C5W3_9LACT|nr:ATP-dependent DNA helicase [Marinilactibacillus psychrotolerans]